MDSTAPKCRETTKAGLPCPAYAQHNSKFCFLHDPANADKAALVRISRTKKLAGLPDAQAPQSPQDIATIMSQVLAGVLRGEIDPRISNSASYIVNQLIKSMELSQLEKRVQALEKLAGKRVIEVAEPSNSGAAIDADSHPIEGEENG